MEKKPDPAPSITRAVIGFACLFLLYQSAEGVGDRLLQSFPVQAGLMMACLIAAWPVSRWLGFRGLAAFALPLQSRALAWVLPLLVLALALKAAALQAGLALGTHLPDATPSAPLATLAAALPMLLLSTFVPSIAEDILTRGFPYRASGIHWRQGVAFVVASSLLYVANHLYRLALGPTEWLTLFVFGLAYATACGALAACGQPLACIGAGTWVTPRWAS